MTAVPPLTAIERLREAVESSSIGHDVPGMAPAEDVAEVQALALVAIAEELHAARTAAEVSTPEPDYCGDCGAHADDPHREGCQWYEAPDTTPVGPR